MLIKIKNIIYKIKFFIKLFSIFFDVHKYAWLTQPQPQHQMLNLFQPNLELVKNRMLLVNQVIDKVEIEGRFDQFI